MKTRFGKNAEKKTIPDRFIWDLEGVKVYKDSKSNKLSFDVKLAIAVLVVFVVILL